VGDNHSLENQTIIKPENILQLSAMVTLTLASPVLVQLFISKSTIYDIMIGLYVKLWFNMGLNIVALLLITHC
jgi:hypothetical protein